MRKRDWFVILAFLGILAFLFFVVRPAHGDDFDARVAQLKAKMAAKRAAKTADPFTPDNAAKPAQIESDQPDNPWVLYPDGSYYRYTPEQMRQRRQPVYQPAPTYYQPMTFGRFRSFGGGACVGSS